mgnify:CR=1 FL=1
MGRTYDGHQHGDLGLSAGGGEFFMTYALAASPLSPRPAVGAGGTHLLPGTGRRLPGVQGQQPGDAWQTMDGELLLVYADSTVAQPHLLRLAHHRASGCGYWVQPRASLSLAGRYAVFASDW